MTRMTGPDCAVMCNVINTHTHTHTQINTHTHFNKYIHTHTRRTARPSPNSNATVNREIPLQPRHQNSRAGRRARLPRLQLKASERNHAHLLVRQGRFTRCGHSLSLPELAHKPTQRYPVFEAEVHAALGVNVHPGHISHPF